MTLYEIDSAITALVDPETGEITDLDALNNLQMERDAKIENVACWMKNLKAEAEAIKAEEQTLKERRDKLTNRADGLKAWLAYVLDGQKFETPKCAITWRKSTAVNVTDNDALIAWAKANGRDDMLKFKEPEIVKKAVGDYIKAGGTLPGAEITESLNVGVK